MTKLRILKSLGWVFGLLLALYVVYRCFTTFVFSTMFYGPNYDASDLIKNYEKRASEIHSAKVYFQSILPPEASVNIEFNNDEIAIFHTKVSGKYDSNWDIDYHSAKTDSLLTQIGWNYKHLEELKRKLDAANCISISGSNNITIGWQRSGMGMFFYHIFDHALDSTEIKSNNGGCTHIFYEDNIVLGYGGGAIGPQCFPKYQRPEN